MRPAVAFGGHAGLRGGGGRRSSVRQAHKSHRGRCRCTSKTSPSITPPPRLPINGDSMRALKYTTAFLQHFFTSEAPDITRLWRLITLATFSILCSVVGGAEPITWLRPLYILAGLVTGILTMCAMVWWARKTIWG